MPTVARPRAPSPPQGAALGGRGSVPPARAPPAGLAPQRSPAGRASLRGRAGPGRAEVSAPHRRSRLPASALRDSALLSGFVFGGSFIRLFTWEWKELSSGRGDTSSPDQPKMCSVVVASGTRAGKQKKTSLELLASFKCWGGFSWVQHTAVKCPNLLLAAQNSFLGFGFGFGGLFRVFLVGCGTAIAATSSNNPNALSASFCLSIARLRCRRCFCRDPQQPWLCKQCLCQGVSFRALCMWNYALLLCIFCPTYQHFCKGFLLFFQGSSWPVVETQRGVG